MLVAVRKLRNVSRETGTLKVKGARIASHLYRCPTCGQAWSKIRMRADRGLISRNSKELRIGGLESGLWDMRDHCRTHSIMTRLITDIMH